MSATSAQPQAPGTRRAPLRWLRSVSWLFAMLGGAAASAVALMMVWSIASRAITTRPVQGDVELTSLGIAVCISLCLPWCQLHGGNIIVDFFTQNARPRLRQWYDGFGALLLALMVGLLAWRTAVGAVGVREAGEETMILGLPLWWMYAALAPGFVLTALVALIQAAMHFAGRDTRDLQS